MAVENLAQHEADVLLAMEKHRVHDNALIFPARGGRAETELQSPNGRNQFLLYVGRGYAEYRNVSMHNRTGENVVLARLDIGGPAHRNPDDEEIPCPHLHLYSEVDGYKWAIPLPPECFTPASDPYRTLDEFMSYCNITRPPRIQRGLFP